MAFPTRCIDPIIKLCQDCPYGWVKYPEWVENYDDTIGCCFESGCCYGLEDTVPTDEEIKEFEQYLKEVYRKDEENVY